MLHPIVVWALAALFAGAGLFNAAATDANRATFRRWGYPSWWCRLTGLLEIADAVLIAVPATRLPGLVLGALVVAAAILTVLRHRDWGHLVPLGVFAALLALAAVPA